jgi:hypothetical protein
MEPPMKPLSRSMVVVTGLLNLLLLSGCGLGAGAHARVKGKVTLDGKTVPTGTISFFGPDKRVASTQIQSDGSYDIPDAPVGENTITVETPDPSKMMGPMGPVGQGTRPPGVGMPADKDPGKGGLITSPDKIVPVPPIYHKAETSPIKYTVQKTDQEYDVKLTK